MYAAQDKPSDETPEKKSALAALHSALHVYSPGRI
jgi:hypothetical protein